MKKDQETSHYKLRPKHRIRHQILWGVALFILAFFIGAYYFNLNEVVVTNGRVIPANQVKIIQSLKGGIIKKIPVKEGEYVKKGQLLIVLDDTDDRSKLNELNIEITTLGIQLQRLKDEIDNIPFSPSVSQHEELEKDIILRQKQLYESRQHEYHSLEESRNYAKNELDMSAPLKEKGIVSDAEILHLQEKVSEFQYEIDHFRSETLKKYREVQTSLSIAKEKKVAVTNEIEQMHIHAPITGTISQIHVTTINGVIKPGMNIMEIIPEDNSLIIEAHVKPRDIGFISEGQEAIVKISAFDFAIYGKLKGKVIHVSADSTQDEKKQRYYEVWIRTANNYLISPRAKKPLYINSGMEATVDIITGHKSLLDYLLKPILRGFRSPIGGMH